MKRVFVSSIQRDFEDLREVAKAAVESFGLFPVMAEMTPASARPSRDTLLGLVRGCDVVLLLVGARYGETGESGFSPTEDEFNAAVAAGIPVIPLIQDAERESAQQDFIGRLRGSWESGYYAPTFTDRHDLTLRVVAALRAHFDQEQDSQARPAATERLMELATEPTGYGSQGSMARLSLVVIGQPLLLDALALEDSKLADELLTLTRSHQLVSQAMALSHSVSSAGFVIEGKEAHAFEGVTVKVGAHGEIVVQSSVAADGLLGGMQVADWKVNTLAERGLQFAAAALDRIDLNGVARQVVAVLSVPDASNKLYVLSSQGNSSRVPSIPSPLVAPELQTRREDVAAENTRRALVAGLKRAFADHGALEE